MAPLEYFPYIFLLTVLILSAIIDYRIQKIPNIITFPTILIFIAYHTASNGFDGFIFSLLGLTVGMAVFILPYMMGGMGAGDAKLMGAAGAMLGWKGALTSFVYVALVGGVYALVILLRNIPYFKKVFSESIETIKMFVLTKKIILEDVATDANRPRLCYGVAIAIGTSVYIGLDIVKINTFMSQ